MPRRGKVKSLKECSLHSIAQNEEKHCWCADYPEHLPTCESNFHGPIARLPPELREELWNVLVKTEKMRMNHLPIFFHSNLTQLDLTECLPLIKLKPSSIFRTLFTIYKIKKLKRLNLKAILCIPPGLLCKLPTRLTNLTHLKVSATNFNNRACAALGQHCHQLEELYLSETRVTDQGMINLCSSSPDELKKCTKLRHLTIYDTKVTVEGVKVVLQNVPGIQYLFHPCLYLAVAELHEDYTEGQIIPPEHQYQLRHMDLEGRTGDLCEDYVRINIAYCPSIIELDVRCWEKPGIWPILPSVQGLEYMEVWHAGDTEFGPSILPIVQVNGETLQCLKLDSVTHIDLAVIGALCPLLDNLHIALYGFTPAFEMFNRNTLPDLIRAGNAHRFQRLTEFNVDIGPDADHSSRDLDLSEVLMYGKNLERIFLNNLPEVDDALLEKVLRVNPLKQLEVVILSSCNRISGPAVAQLLLLENNLSSLVLMKCENITMADRENMLKLVEEQGNMDIEIEINHISVSVRQ